MAVIDIRGASLTTSDPPIATNPNPDLAWKAPVRAATAGSNMTLSGLQTIDGISLNTGDRVLVKDQTDATTNGLYNAQTGPWTRTIDAQNNSQWAQGLQVLVTSGSVNADVQYVLTAANPVILGTSALTFVVLPTKLKSVITTPADFGAVGDGVTDDTTPLTNFFNTLIATPGIIGVIQSKTYAISAALPTITASGVILLGAGPAGSHDVGSQDVGAVIKWIGSSGGGPMLTVAPVSGPTSQSITGIEIGGVTFDCNSLAATGVVIQSVRYCDFNFTVLNATTTGCKLGVVSSLGEAASLQMNRFRYTGRQVEAPNGISLVLTGDSTDNVSFNWFETVDIAHFDAVAIQEQNADNNLWGLVRTFMHSPGTATASIEWDGGATTVTRCRSEQFLRLSTNLAAIAKGTSSFTVAAQNIRIFQLDEENSTPAPTLETGATAYWQYDSTPFYPGAWIIYTPTITAGSGTFTTVSATGRYRQTPHGVDVEIVITITTNGTAASYINASLPFTSGASAADVWAGKETSTGNMVTGVVASAVSTLLIQKYDGTYQGGNGQQIIISGSYELT